MASERGGSLRERISLVWPMYADELLYILTPVTETNREAIMKLVGLEFWGQERVEIDKTAYIINKKYIYGVIDNGTEKSILPAVPVSIINPLDVKEDISETGVGGGQTIHEIPPGKQYACLFEKMEEPQLVVAPPKDGFIKEKNYALSLALDKNMKGKLIWIEE
jgi:hypothetical protein